MYYLLGDIQEMFDNIPQMVEDHWVKVAGAILFSIVTAGWGLFKAWQSWRKRNDMDIIHISQNTFEKRNTGEDNKEETWLILDVFFEDALSKVIDHPIVRWLIHKAAKKTTYEQPFCNFGEKDKWYVLNIIRLGIAEKFITATAAKMAKTAKVEVVNCVFALTYERYPNMRQGKLRVMIVREDDLVKTNFDLPFRFENKSHFDRVQTLKLMQEDFKKGTDAKYCMDVRINIQVN